MENDLARIREVIPEMIAQEITPLSTEELKERIRGAKRGIAPYDIYKDRNDSFKYN